VDIELSENLRRVQKMLVLEDPEQLSIAVCKIKKYRHVLLCVPGEQRKVEDQGNPVTVDQEENGDASVDGGFGDNVGVEAVAEVDGVDVVAARR
jgi:hypothetical protein